LRVGLSLRDVVNVLDFEIFTQVHHCAIAINLGISLFSLGDLLIGQTSHLQVAGAKNGGSGIKQHQSIFPSCIVISGLLNGIFAAANLIWS
jgi:hypothetical protein